MSAPAAVAYDPFTTPSLDDPQPVYRYLRDHEPVHHVDSLGLWVLSRFDDVEAAVRDPATFMSGDGITVDRADVGIVPTLLTLDPPRHDQLRRLASRAFTPRTVTDLEPRVREVTRQLLDEVVGDGSSPFDAMAFAGALPAIVIAELLGVPASQHELFRRWVESVVSLDPATMAKGAATMFELYGFLQAIIDERTNERRPDLISALLDAEVDGERLSADEILGFVLVLLAAGFETTKNLIGNGLVLLADRPIPADRWPEAVEEVLRIESPVVGLCRVATREVALHGTTIPAGGRVQLLYAAANRDERAFDHPDDIDLDRQDGKHLAFGQGIHFCLGAALARLEGRVAFEELRARVPAYDVLSSERIRSPYIRGFTSLVLTSL